MDGENPFVFTTSKKMFTGDVSNTKSARPIGLSNGKTSKSAHENLQDIIRINMNALTKKSESGFGSIADPFAIPSKLVRDEKTTFEMASTVDEPVARDKLNNQVNMEKPAFTFHFTGVNNSNANGNEVVAPANNSNTTMTITKNMSKSTSDATLPVNSKPLFDGITAGGPTEKSTSLDTVFAKYKSDGDRKPGETGIELSIRFHK